MLLSIPSVGGAVAWVMSRIECSYGNCETCNNCQDHRQNLRNLFKGLQKRPHQSYENCENYEIYENCEICNNFFPVRLPSTLIRRTRQRIRILLNLLSRVERNKSAMNLILVDGESAYFRIRWWAKSCLAVSFYYKSIWRHNGNLSVFLVFEFDI